LNEKLSRWNALPFEQAAHEIQPCCGSLSWATRMAADRPIKDEASLFGTADTIWADLGKSDWREAFRSHPRIGETGAHKNTSEQSSTWSKQEQQRAATADDEVRAALRDGNLKYEQKFGRIFIVCAAGKSAGEILALMRRRLENDETTELREAAEEQRQIMHLRLKKWLAE
jgi:2-oxo-4-hydroxy-4-carboxy-5-ureidoimidazoline decarboxylase